MTIADISKLYKPERRILDIVTEDDLEMVVLTKFKLRKDDFGQKEWDALLMRCSQKIRINRNYENLFRNLKEELLDSAVPILLKTEKDR